MFTVKDRGYHCELGTTQTHTVQQYHSSHDSYNKTVHIASYSLA